MNLLSEQVLFLHSLLRVSFWNEVDGLVWRCPNGSLECPNEVWTSLVSLKTHSINPHAVSISNRL